MKIQKQVLGELDKCYSISPLMFKGEEHILVAAEKVNKCLLFNKKGELIDTIWEQPGGTMSMVPIPGKEGEFLATHRFYSPNDCKDASIVYVKYNGESWDIKTLLELPGVHRFDLVKNNDRLFLIACCLKTNHEYKEDWRFLGKVYAGEFDVNNIEGIKLSVIKEGMLKNHGYSKYNENGVDNCIVSCDDGVYKFRVPSSGEDWQIEKLLDRPASDAMYVDMDGDGERELIVLSPFHGDELRFYKKVSGKFEPVFEFPQPIEFLHSMWSGKIGDKTYAIIGHRKGLRNLYAFSYNKNNESYEYEVIDEDVGSTNVAMFEGEGEKLLISTNREINEIAMYHIKY